MRYLLLIFALLLPVLSFAQQGATGQQINPQQVEQILNDFLAEQSDRLPHVELRFSSIDLPQAFQVPAGRIEFEVVPAKPDVIGSRRMTLLTRVAGVVVDNRSIRVELEALAEILIAAENLQRRDVLTPEKVEFRLQDISDLNQPLFDDEEIYGKRLKRSARVGQPLLRRQIDFPPMVKRRDKVTIQARRGGLLLTAAGEAKEDGQEGDMIRVINLGSRKVVLGRVTAPGLVEVEF